MFSNDRVSKADILTSRSRGLRGHSTSAMDQPEDLREVEATLVRLAPGKPTDARSFGARLAEQCRTEQG